MAEYSARRLASLREFDLIAAAQVVLRRLEAKDLVVKNTYLLLEKVKWKVPMEVEGMSPKQRKMMAFAARYHGKSVAEPVRAAASPSVGAEGAARRTQMVEFAEKYHREHSYL